MTPKKKPRHNLSLSPNTFTKFCWKCEPFSKRRTSASWSTAGSKQIRRSRSRHPDCENLQSSSRKHQRTQKRARRAPSWAPSSAYCDFFLLRCRQSPWKAPSSAYCDFFPFRCRQAPWKAPSSFTLRCRLAPSAAPSSCEEKTGTGLDEHSSPRCENGWTEILQFPSLTLTSGYPWPSATVKSPGSFKLGSCFRFF